MTIHFNNDHSANRANGKPNKKASNKPSEEKNASAGQAAGQKNTPVPAGDMLAAMDVQSAQNRQAVSSNPVAGFDKMSQNFSKQVREIISKDFPGFVAKYDAMPQSQREDFEFRVMNTYWNNNPVVDTNSQSRNSYDGLV